MNERERRKLIAGVREMVGLLSAAELADLIEHIKDVIRQSDSASHGPPLVIVKDMQTHDSADLPDEALHELIRIVGVREDDR